MQVPMILKIITYLIIFLQNYKFRVLLTKNFVPKNLKPKNQN